MVGFFAQRVTVDSLTKMIDITYDSGPIVINRYMQDEDKVKFLKPGYRIRIVK
jgi:hypothetical protein